MADNGTLFDDEFMSKLTYLSIVSKQMIPGHMHGEHRAKQRTDAGIEYLGKIEEKLDFEEVVERATRLVDGVSSRARQIEILSAYVQDEVHYEAIEFGRRAYIPKTARETMRDRYGDCKDLSTLLISDLQTENVRAYPALVLTRDDGYVDPSFPSFEFNHVIKSGRLFLNRVCKFAESPILFMYDLRTTSGQDLLELVDRFLHLTFRQNGSCNENGFVLVQHF